MTTTSLSRFAHAALSGFGICALVLTLPAPGQDYVFSTIAGAPGGPGSDDGRGSAARFKDPIGVAVDGSGNVFVADTGNHTIRRITADGVVTTLAGSVGNSGSADGTGSAARFNWPGGVAVDGSGNVFVVDTRSHTIRRIAADGTVTTLAGSAGRFGSTDGPGNVARFSAPRGLAADMNGNLYVADTGNHTIRKVTADGVVSTLAGLALSSGSRDGTGGEARFESVQGVAVDGSGNVFVTEGYHGAIRKITAAGEVTTLAVLPDGFAVSTDVAADANGNVFVTDSNDHTIRRIDVDGTVTTIAGVAGSAGCLDGAAGSARFYQPNGVAVDAAGNVYIADTGNHNIRKIAGGVVTIFAGGAGASLTDGSANIARFHDPRGVAVDGSGNLYVADTGNFAIRRIAAQGVVTTLAVFPPPFGYDVLDGLALDDGGNVIFIDNYDGDEGWGEPDGSTIRRLSAGGVVTALAGSAYRVGSNDGAGSAARFSFVEGITMDAHGNVFLADTDNHTVRKMDRGGSVTTVAGLAVNRGSADGVGSAARFYRPGGVAVDAHDNVFVADTFNHTIRKISSSGMVSTVAGLAGDPGSADGAGGAARFRFPRGLALDAHGNLFVADTSNHMIRKVTPEGVVTTVAGQAESPGSEDGPGSMARLKLPRGVAVDDRGNLFIADSGNYTIRRGTVATVPAIVTQPQSQTVARGRIAAFNATASGSPAPTFQWTRDGVAVVGATDATLILTDVSPASAGIYQCVVTNSLGSTTSAAVTLRVVEAVESMRFHNLSARASVTPGGVIIAGFVVEGAQQKTVLVRGIGATLAGFGVSNPIGDPRLEIFDSAGSLLAENDNWFPSLADVFTLTGAFALPTGSTDAAILLPLQPGAHTAVLKGVGDATGEALIEVYELP